MSRTIDVSGLSDARIREIESLVHAYRTNEVPSSAQTPREVGWAKGWIVPDDAFASLSSDELKDWESVEKFKIGENKIGEK